MPTPVSWKNKFQVNTGDAAIGLQSDVRIIGLRNRILVVWTEDAAGIVGGGAGTNIIGQYYDLLGVKVGSPVQLNSVSTADDERDFDVAPADFYVESVGDFAAFVLVYLDDDIGTNTTGIIWELHNFEGETIVSKRIATESADADSLSNPQVTFNLETGQSLVTFGSLTSLDNDVRAILVNADGSVGAPFDAAQNSADFAGNADVAILANGNYVSVYRETDAGVTGAEARIVTGTGTPIDTLTLTTAAVGVVKVATLANGNWVAVWSETGVGNGDVKYAIYSPAGGAPLLAATSAASGTNVQGNPDVVARPEGGFVIAWDNDTNAVLEGMSFTAAGAPDGGVFEIENGGGSDPDLGITVDGRLLISWIAPGGELFASIWDPRSSPINGSDYTEETRNFLDAFAIYGGAGNDTMSSGGASEVHGLGGNDVLTGKGFLFGGDGNDVVRTDPSAFGMDFLYGGRGDDILILGSSNNFVREEANEGNDAVYVGASYSGLVSTTLSIETLATTNQAAITTINLFGSETGNSIFGNEGNNQLLGFGGVDQLVGYGGNDVLVGGAGIDYMRGGLGNDVYGIDENDVILEAAGEGDDSLAANVGSYFLNDDASIETLSTANQAGTFAQNLTGNNFAQSIAGSQGANVLNGRLGNDLLRGYGGADIFLFDTAPGADNHDVIADMVVGVDRIALQNSVFTGLAEGNLGAGAFRVGTAAQDADDRIIWNAATNQLLYDADGNGAGAAVLFAIVNGSPNLQASDFIIV